MKIILHIWFLVYLTWSKVFRFFERIFISDYDMIRTMKKDEIRLAKAKYLSRDNVHTFAQLKEYWDFFVNHYKWKSDKWWMAYDAISTPYGVMIRKGDDCDGFAFLSKELIEGFLRIKRNEEFDDSYLSSGVWFFIKKNLRGGHAISVWKNVYPPSDYIVVSNKEMLRFADEDSFFRWMENSFFDFNYIVKVDKNLDVISVDKV